MPSFLSKVFGRKKDDKDTLSPTSPTTEKRSSAPPLLDGKYEAVSPAHPSPSTSSFQDNTRLTTGPSKDSPLALFRPKSKNVEHAKKSNVNQAPAPHLTLNLPANKEESNRALDVVFESVPEEPAEKDLGERRLTPAETLKLVQASSKAIIEHGGLEALGLMHPHWYASSDEVQRRLVSLFLLSLASRTSTSSPETAFALFDSELKYTRASHDVAGVLRWGLRHLKLEGSSFGKDASEWEWYAKFASSERQAGFPPTAFSKTLVPLLPPSHVQLLKATLDIIESLAAHAEANGSSGSKLSKLFGLWLVAAQRVNKEEDWAEFYKRWETAGRVLEHLFLAHVREESSLSKMPLRLSELVKHYPYGTTASTEANEALPFLVQPRFSTRTYEALYVRLNTELPSIDSPQPSRKHPLHLISEAIAAKTADNASLANGVVLVWEDISKQALSSDKATNGSPVLSQVLDDETIRILSLVPGAELKLATPIKTTETAPPTSPIIRAPTRRRRSSSLGPASRPAANGNGHEAAPPTDWADFSKLGFGESSLGPNLNLSLNNSDVEVTPSKVETPVASKRRRASSPGRGRKSLDNPRENGRSGSVSTPELSVLLTHVGAVTIDEAFFEFWSDALLDPIAADWPNFVVAQLKPSAWKYPILIVEQTFTRPAPPPLPPIPQFENTTRRASSPRPSLAPSSRGRRSFNFSPTIKRFSFFSNHNTSATDVNSKAAPHKGKAVTPSSTKSPKIGELGEIVPEETIPESTPAKDASKESTTQGLGITVAEKKQERGTAPVSSDAVAATAVAAATAATVANAATSEANKVNKNEHAAVSASIPPIPGGKEKEDLPPVPLVESEPIDVSTSAGEVHPVTVEPVKTEEEAPARPSISSDRATPVATNVSATSGKDAEKQLPPAPEAVVLTGGTPGPQVALETSEPVTLAHTSEQEGESTAETTSPVVENTPPLPTKDEAVPVVAQDEPSQTTIPAESVEPTSELAEPAVAETTLAVQNVVPEEAFAVAAEESAVVNEVAPPAPVAEVPSAQEDKVSSLTENEVSTASAEQSGLSSSTSPESAEVEVVSTPVPAPAAEPATEVSQAVEHSTVPIAEDNEPKDDTVVSDRIPAVHEEGKASEEATPEATAAPATEPPVQVERLDDTTEAVTSTAEDSAVTATTEEQATSEAPLASQPSQDDPPADATEIPEVHKPALDTSDDTPAPRTETEVHKEESVVESGSS